MKMTQSRTNDGLLLGAMAAVSWLGAYIHTTLELGLPIWRPENSVPAIIGMALLLGWWRQPARRRVWTWLLLIWTAGGHLLLGAILSVLPLPLWPFTPEQSLDHYLSHLLYAVAQVPLIWMLLKQLWQQNGV